MVALLFFLFWYPPAMFSFWKPPFPISFLPPWVHSLPFAAFAVQSRAMDSCLNDHSPESQTYMARIFVKGIPGTRMISADASWSIEEVKEILHCKGDVRLATHSRQLAPHELIRDVYPGGCGHLLVLPRLRGGGKFATWESTAARQGLRVADLDDLIFPSWEGECRMEHWPISMVEESSCGISFATIASAEKVSDVRTVGPLILVIKGFDNERLAKMGFGPERLICTNIGVRDEVAKTTELRAVTLVSMSASEDDFVELPKADHLLSVQTVNRMPVFVELRQSDATSKDWTDLSSSEAFEGYVRILLQKCGMCEQTVRYKPFSRQGYWCQRLQIPAAHRDQLYRMSGLSSVQIRAVRSMTDPAESGLEVLRIDVDKTLAVLAEECKLSGALGFFRSQGKTFFRTSDPTIAAARKFFYPDDERFTVQNIGIKMKHFYVVEGFPLGVAIREVTEALESIGWIAIPVRITNLRQLSRVLAAGADPPAKLKYSTSIGMLHLTLAEKPTPTQKGSAVIAPTPSRPRSFQQTPASKEWPKRERVAPPPISTPSTVSSSSGQVSQNAPSTSLATRVTQLEAQLGTVQSDVKGLRTSQEMLEKNLVDLGHRQDRGFTDLMAAIQALSAESSSSQKASPARKSLKK